ncbi:large ribosomal subunit protein bL21m [Gastrophryne carolinensis]
MALSCCGRLLTEVIARRGVAAATVSLLQPSHRCLSSPGSSLQPSYVPKTSLSEPPWPKLELPDIIEEAEQHKELVKNVNNLIATGQFGRLFAVIHFASKQWKVTNEDLVLINGSVEAECGDRIRLEKVLLVGSDNFTLIGKPLLGKELVRVEATVIEKTESHPKINMKFWKRHRYQKKKIIITPQTILRINTIEISPVLS